VLGVQIVFYALAAVGAVAGATGRRITRWCAVPYYFCLSNLAAALAVCSLVRGTRYETWEPAATRARYG
jgi:hypothetical protein